MAAETESETSYTSSFPGCGRHVVGLNGFTYDNNGNQLVTASTLYDVFNRMKTANGSTHYAYAADNKRVLKMVGGTVELTHYGITGQRMSTYALQTCGGFGTCVVEQTRNVWFGAKLIRTGPVGSQASVVVDSAGSVRVRKVGSAVERLDYYPYGEEKPGATADGREKFATYLRDGTLDYADQRHYMWQYGRFTAPDPYVPSAGTEDPSSWNRYTYVRGDPINAVDPSGLFDCPQNTVISTTIGGVTYRTTTIYVCHEITVFGYLTTLQNLNTGYYTSTFHFTGYQNFYEQPGCSTPNGVACYVADIARALFNSTAAPGCSELVDLSRCDPGNDDDGEIAGAAPSGRGRAGVGGLIAVTLNWLRMRAIQQIGADGERLVLGMLGAGYRANSTGSGRTVLDYTISGVQRIPDIVNAAAKHIVEVKNVQAQQMTAQIKDMALWANMHGWNFTLYLRDTVENRAMAAQNAWIHVKFFTYP